MNAALIGDGVETPRWDAPAGVAALASTRRGGVSVGPYASLNLRLPHAGDAVADDPDAVATNRARFVAAMGGARPVWLEQVHGVEVVRLRGADPSASSTTGAPMPLPPALTAAPLSPPRADAAFTTDRGVACTVMVADCLPVLLASDDGAVVAAAHAGWRGLAGGVVEATLEAMCSAVATSPDRICAWLGPCIGPRRFEVGVDVVDAFGPAAAVHFRPQPGTVAAGARWLADLPGLARDRLRAAGVRRISLDGRCTVEQASTFFSFRRDRVTGRQAACVWRV